MRNIPGAALRVAFCAAGLLLVSSLSAIEPAEEFLEGLRERKLFDMAIEYLDSVKESDAVSVDFKRAYLYERGKTLVAGAKFQRDAALREKQLDDAQKSLNEFIANPTTPELAISARNQLGNVIIERARARVEKSKKQADQKDKLLTEARGLYPEAIKVFTEQAEEVKQRLLQFPKAGLDPKKDAKKIEQRDAFRLEYLQAMLLLAAAREEIADAYSKEAPERKKALEEAEKEYAEIHKDFRTLIAGMYAQLYQARCLQKLGKHKEALGHFKELLDQPDNPEAFRKLKVATTSIAMDSWLAEKSYVEAVSKGLAICDSARPTETNTEEFMSLRVSTAKACKLYADELKAKEPNNVEIKRSLTNGRKLLQFVQRSPNDFQNEARRMLADFAGVDVETTDKVKPKNFDEAKTQGQEAIQEMQSAQTIVKALGPRVAAEKDPKIKAESQKQLEDATKSAADNKEKALYYFGEAMAMADDKSSLDDLNLIRYLLCFLKFSDGHYYDAVVLGEFIARRFPASSGARPCAKIALAAYLKLYSDNKSDNKDFESAKIVDVADYIVKTWPDQPEAEEALNTLIPFMIKERQIDRARAYLAKISPDSKFRGAAELKTGQALWSQYLEGMREVREWETGEGNPPEANEIAKRKQDLETLKTEARDTLANGVKRMQSGAEINTIVASAVLSLAQIYVDTNEAGKAVALLEDPKMGTLILVQKNDPAVEKDPIPEETFKTALRAYISSLSVKGANAEATIEKAKAIMAALKARIGATPEGQTKLVSIYFSLARDLQRQMDYAPADVKSALGEGFKVFLDQVGKDATELNVLNWVAETYRGMGESFIADGKVTEEGRKYLEEAVKVYTRILDLGKSDKKFINETQSLQLRLSLAKTQRSMGKYVEAMNSFEEILKTNTSMLPMQIEAAKTYQQWASLFKGDETKQWQYYSSAIVGARPDKTNANKAKQGKNVIWGWGELARMTANDPRFKDAFHESRYNLALCRYRMGLATKDAAKKEKTMKQAKSDIAITRGLFPDLGGDKWRAQYDKLYKDVQKQLGEKPVGLSALDESAKTAASSGGSSGSK